MAKEALFNILDNKISLNNINVLDIFCGTGNISYEFASRGAGKITSVDNQINAINFVFFVISINKERHLIIGL